MKRYPLGVQVFEDSIMENLVFVDKTRQVWDLINTGSKYVFLGRPRRFALTDKPLTLVGINFSTQERNLTEWVIAPA